MGHVITSSSLCKGMDKPSQAGSSLEVDYEDVFGGPPRFLTLMSAPHSGTMPSATLDRATARAPSFRNSSLPVFDLPVFGDNANVFGSTVYDARANSDVYDDIFDEEGHMPDAFLASNVYGISKSKASSRSSSRRMSPVHPAVASASQPGGDEFLVLTSSASFSKTRPAAGKLSKRGSLHSASSFDESGGKLADGPLTGLRNDSFTSSRPSSPPQSGSSGHLKSFIGSTGSINAGAPTTTIVEFDDVFGGFPKRTFSQPFSTVPHDPTNIVNASESHSARIPALETPGLSRVCSSSSVAHALDTSDSMKCTLSRSSSINDGRGQHDKEIRIDRQTDSSVLEWSELIAGDASLSFQSSSKLPPPTPSPAPVTQLKFKSWKDWVSELPTGSHTSTSSSIVPDVTAASLVMPIKEVVKDKDVVELLIEKQSDKSLPAQQYTEKPSHTTAAGHKAKVKSVEHTVEKFKSAEHTVEMEEKELQALLSNAWKINEQIEKERYNAKFPEEVPKVSQDKYQESHQKEQRKHSMTQSKSSLMQQCDRVDLDERNDDINWKEWKKYGRGQRKEVSRDGGSADQSSTKSSTSLKKQVSVSDMARCLAGKGVTSGAAKAWDTEQVLRADTEEAMTTTNCVLASFEVSADGSAGLDCIKKPGKGICGEDENGEHIVKEQRLGRRSDDLDRVPSFHGSMSGSSLQEFLHSDEQNRISLSVQVEDSECLIDLASSLDGFQEIEGESYERRKSRWERHKRARDRAAKALEEIQHRDAELQRQQKEKQQFSETSDGKIKRWAAGKEGNLRALLSNLQHVLWSECGWQPIPLSDLIEVPDVKKAYRKATLFVHPDKVQQKRATIQQKYIAERVFDILQLFKKNTHKKKQQEPHLYEPPLKNYPRLCL